MDFLSKISELKVSDKILMAWSNVISSYISFACEKSLVSIETMFASLGLSLGYIVFPGAVGVHTPEQLFCVPG